jgi:hypothetical protein
MKKNNKVGNTIYATVILFCGEAGWLEVAHILMTAFSGCSDLIIIIFSLLMSPTLVYCHKKEGGQSATGERVKLLLYHTCLP